MTAIDAKAFWHTLGERAVGVTVVTVDGENGPSGFLGLSASHVTADPPTMLVSIDKKTSALADILAKGHFAINYLPKSAEGLIDVFGGKTDLDGAARFQPEQWSVLATGAPVHVDALGAFDCTVEDTIDRGGTVIVIGRVVEAIARGTGDPLILFRGKPYPADDA